MLKWVESSKGYQAETLNMMEAPADSHSAMSKKERAKMKQEGLLQKAYSRIESLEAELASLRASSQDTVWEIVEDVADAPVELHDHPFVTSETIRLIPAKPIWQGRCSDSQGVSELHSNPILKTDCIEATAALQKQLNEQHSAIHVPMLELSQIAVQREVQGKVRCAVGEC